MTVKRMTREEFKAEVLLRGWTYRALARRWGVSENWIGQVARNENRPLHWDDALRGLPTVIKPKKHKQPPTESQVSSC